MPVRIDELNIEMQTTTQRVEPLPCTRTHEGVEASNIDGRPGGALGIHERVSVATDVCVVQAGSHCGVFVGEAATNSKRSMTRNQKRESRVESRLRPQRLNDSGFRDCFRAMPQTIAPGIRQSRSAIRLSVVARQHESRSVHASLC